MRDSWVSGLRRRSPNGSISNLADETHSISEDPRVYLYQYKRRRLAQLTDITASVPATNIGHTFLRIPLDIWFEIFALLEPVHVLQLARTCKDLRGTLMHRSSTWIWKMTREHIPGLPDCPAWLSEPAYADLVFEHHCYRCYRDCRQVASPLLPVIWEFRARYCEMCHRTLVIDRPSLNTFSLPPQIRAHPEEFLCTLWKDGNRFYDRAEVEGMMQQYTATSNQDNRDRKTELICERQRERTKLVMETYDSYSRYMEERARASAIDVRRRKERRGEDILQRLKDEGIDVKFLANWRLNYAMRADVLFSKREVLTDAVWSDIRDRVVTLVDSLNLKHDLEARQQVVKERLALFQFAIPTIFLGVAPGNIRPRTIDLATIPAIKEILDLPSDATVTLESFEPLRPQLTELVRRWRADAKTQLLLLIRKAQLARGESFRKDVNPFELARTLFSCTRCHAVLNSQTVLVHGCSAAAATASMDPTQVQYEHIAMECLWGRLWDAQVFDWRRGADAADAIIRACGLEPDFATAKEADQAGARLSCSACCNATRSRVVMGWRSAIYHSLREHSHEGAGGWDRVTEAEAVRVKELEASSRTLSEEEHRSRLQWVCARCWSWHLYGLRPCDPNTTDPLEPLKDHLRTTHHIQKPEKGNDYFLRPDSYPFLPKRIVLLNEKLTPSKLNAEEKALVEKGLAGWKSRG